MSGETNLFGVKKITAEEALKTDLWAEKMIAGMKSTTMDAALARNILAGDLGEFKDRFLTAYSLDEDTRDRLIAHARQDAAHAVLIAVRNQKQIAGLKRMAWVLMAMCGTILWLLLR